MKKIIFLFLLFTVECSSSTAFAQKEGQLLIDSLLTQLPKAADDTARVNLLVSISYTYLYINPDKGLKYGNQALELAEKINWKKGIANAEKRIGNNYSTKSDHPKVLEYWFKALKIFEELADKKGIAGIYNCIGTVYNNQSDYATALNYYFKALKINKEIANKSWIASNLSNIGDTHLRKKDYMNALQYNFQSLTIYQDMGDKRGTAITEGNIGDIYKEKSDYSEALEYYFKALKINKQIGHKNFEAINFGGIGGTYYAIATDRKSILLNDMFAGNSIKALQQAKVYTDTAIILGKEIGNLEDLFASYKQLSEILVLMGDARQALQSYKNYVAAKDSVFNEKNNKKITDLEAKRTEEFNQKQLEIKDLLIAKAKSERRFFIAGIFLLLCLSGLLYNRYRIKTTANRRLSELNEELKNTMDNLKATQQQLIQSEKMATFGTLANRMAHEIQNPLNFVTNFSILSEDLINEITKATATSKEKQETIALLKENLEKIHHHSKRASDIIRQLQEHARAGTTHEFFVGE